jgi:hypothetical protein
MLALIRFRLFQAIVYSSVAFALTWIVIQLGVESLYITLFHLTHPMAVLFAIVFGLSALGGVAITFLVLRTIARWAPPRPDLIYPFKRLV